jgi:hypothetical protein
MKLTEAQTAEITARINSAFGSRDIITMNTAGQIGQTNFYGDEAEPKLTKESVFGLIECALNNWNQPEDKDDAEWVDEIVTDIISDIL